MKPKSIKVLNEQMRFVNVPIASLTESDVYRLIKNGQLSIEDFAAWVESERDTWFAYGQNSVDTSK